MYPEMMVGTNGRGWRSPKCPSRRKTSAEHRFMRTIAFCCVYVYTPGRLYLGNASLFVINAFLPPLSPHVSSYLLRKPKAKATGGANRAGDPASATPSPAKGRAKSPAARGKAATPGGKGRKAAAVSPSVGPVPGGISGSSIYCVCHSSDEGFMVECSDGTGGCGGWFHPQCCNLELTPEQMQKSECRMSHVLRRAVSVHLLPTRRPLPTLSMSHVTVRCISSEAGGADFSYTRQF